MRLAPCCDVLRHVGCCWLRCDHFQTWTNNTQHVTTHRNTVPNVCNMLRPTMWRYVALTGCDRLAGVSLDHCLMARRERKKTGINCNPLTETFIDFVGSRSQVYFKIWALWAGPKNWQNCAPAQVTTNLSTLSRTYLQPVRSKVNLFILLFNFFLLRICYRKIHYLTREIRVILHAKTDIARIVKRWVRYRFSSAIERGIHESGNEFSLNYIIE